MADYVAGKSIVITGAGSGFGKLVAEKLAARGARLTLGDVDAAAVEGVAAGIRAAGGTAQSCHADVTDITAMQALAAAAVAAHGRIDVMVNNAGIMPLAFIADHAAALAAWSRCIDINFKGVMHGTIAVHDQMIAQGQGHIVNISSIYGNSPVVGASVYGATKAAVNHFSNAVRQEAHGKIKVTVVRPTGVPGTGLGGTVVNQASVAGIVGQNGGEYQQLVGQLMTGQLPPEAADREDPAYAMLKPDDLADAIVQVIDQPLGVTISDITVRATGDLFVI